MQRTFIAIRIYPGDEMSSCLLHLKQELQKEKIKWVDPGSLHITLRFLGDTDPGRVIKTGEALEKAVPGFASPEVVFRGLGLFRNLRDPRVLWIGMDPGKILPDVKEAIDRELDFIGVPPEDRSFRPHLTLARIKFLKDRELLGDLIREYRDFEYQSSLLKEVIYYESILGAGGPEYIPLKEVFFKS